jgi:hypothetical protein
MSSRTPFRSHLLQQWTQQGHRPPVAAVPWLRPASTNGDQNHLRSHSQIQDDDTGAASGEGTARSTSGGRNQRSCSTISSVASSFTLSTYNALQNSRRIDQSFSPIRRVSGSRDISNAAVSSTEKASVSNSDEFSDETDNGFHSLLLSRRTASKPLTFSTTDDAPELRQLEIDHIRNAVDRAVQAAQMAPNHKRTEPFTFVRFWSGSQSAERLADICYQVTLRQKSEPVARKKREKWARIPAFLVALVHDNQHAVDAHECDDPYDQLTFVPPMTNRQLEDVSGTQAKILHVPHYIFNPC